MDTDDHVAICNLINHYCLAIDAGDFDALGELLGDADVHYVNTGVWIRKDAAGIAEMHRRMVRVYAESGTPMTRHLASNLILDEAGETHVQARSCVLVLQAAPGFPLQPIAAARYRDVLERFQGSWRFAERSIEMELAGDLSAHLTAAVGDVSG